MPYYFPAPPVSPIPKTPLMPLEWFFMFGTSSPFKYVSYFVSAALAKTWTLCYLLSSSKILSSSIASSHSLCCALLIFPPLYYFLALKPLFCEIYSCKSSWLTWLITLWFWPKPPWRLLISGTPKFYVSSKTSGRSWIVSSCLEWRFGPLSKPLFISVSFSSR